MSIDLLLTILLGGLVIFAALFFISRYLSSESRMERRRRRSNTRIASKSKHPTVKFSVKTKDDDK